MTARFHFDSSVEFAPERDHLLHEIPVLPGVFALYGQRAEDEPYITRTADLRRRITRLLAPPESQSRRLNLRQRVSRIEYCVTGSEFESLLVLYRAAAAQFGHFEARRRLRLNTPSCLRITMEKDHPRVYSTNRLSKRALSTTYGPFPSRAAADRYCDGVLDLFKLRRCYEDLQPYPEHPGCAYGEMKKCLAPCNQSCTSEQYAAEAAAVKEFFDTHGGSMLEAVAAEREQVSAAMDFERAAAAHAQWQKVKAAASLADEVVLPIAKLRAVIIQASASLEGRGDEAAIFMLEGGSLAGPTRLSTLGVRAVKEQTSVGSSLFAQPLMLQAVPLVESAAEIHREGPEDRAAVALAALAAEMTSAADVAMLSDYLSLFRRWYYRPEKQRKGEMFFPNPDGSWPVRRILRGAARMALGEPGIMTETDRAGAKGAKMRILHAGREGVERVVPVVGRPGTGEQDNALLTALPNDFPGEGDPPG